MTPTPDYFAGGGAGVHRFPHKAMATVFEIWIAETDYPYARQAACAAFEELDRLELELSRYVAHSDISRINSLQSGQSTRIGADAFASLRRCAELCDETGGAFDVTAGLLVDCWRQARAAGRDPSEEALMRLREQTSVKLLELDESRCAVTLRRAPVRVDLGGFGKGYAIDQMADILRDWDVNCALIHGGQSTALGLDPPRGQLGWPVTISTPQRRRTIRHFALRNQALSGSGIRKGPHIIDPRSGRPVAGRTAAWCLARSAATADALSTAFMVMSFEAIGELVARNPGVQAVVMQDSNDEREAPIDSQTRIEGLLYME
jgi:thiamine biosynthesis lipoprotein